MASSGKSKKQQSLWSNRIIGHGDVNPADLLANPRNWRIHPRLQQEVLEDVLDKVGWVDEVIVNQRTGFVVDGHLRVNIALRRHEATVPVKIVDLSEEEEQLVLSLLDPIAALAQVDTDKMLELFDLIGEQNAATQLLLDRLAGRESSVDIDAIYSGMPDFDQEFGEQPFHTVQVHFYSKSAMARFAKQIGIEVTTQTRYLNLPFKKQESRKRFQVVDES